ncbi:prolipoprotein diacylglyceryl transferase [Lachnoclostridium sp. An196]|uniref:prolipoprotein diacylglyceryl transferase n=1 Tax=Lachnoclostridium sp. An196 TaxID=1965583 RepID=UPI000B38D3B6|nr:prolipoprotein diacylglyceryl transferase [Lachnoclostridium sp. An196]OUP18346.1 prolipoprotein diacylglyceryl transferase [Lachnoclostridium sp. An196]
MNTSINFPHLGIYLEHVGKSISVFGFDIAYYGIIIGCSILLGLYLAQREAKRTGQNPDTYTDMVIYAIIVSVICARAYYVIFSWDHYKDNLLSIFNLRQGGLAIYGGIIGAVATVYVYSRVKKLSFPLLLDTACIGLVAGQILGRWGNFFNREAFGGYTDSLFAMQLPVSAVRVNEITEEMWAHVQVIGGEQFIQVHPTFLYESIWNLGVLCFLYWYRDRKKFRGELFLTYVLGYGLGRVWIEGLRTDQLQIGSTGIPVSQLLAGVLILVSLFLIIMGRRRAVREEHGQTEEDQAGD